MGYLSEAQRRKRSDRLGLNGRTTLTNYKLCLSMAELKVRHIEDELKKYKNCENSYVVIVSGSPEKGNVVTKTVGYIRLELNNANEHLRDLIKLKESGKVMTEEEEIGWKSTLSELYYKLKRNQESK